MSLRERERNCVHVCLQRCPSVQLETGWYLNCRIYTSLWPRRQVFLAWTLPLYTNIHAHVSDKRQNDCSALLGCCILIPPCFFFFYNIKIFLQSVTMNKILLFPSVLPSKYSLKASQQLYTVFSSTVLHCTYLSSLCGALSSTAYVNVERAPICHWAACTLAKQYLVSGFNYRFACVCVCIHMAHQSWGLLFYLLSSVNNPSVAPLSSLSVFPTLFFCPLVTCTVECLPLLNTLKMLSLPVGGKSFLPAMSHTWWPICKIFLLPSTHMYKTQCPYQIK